MRKVDFAILAVMSLTSTQLASAAEVSHKDVRAYVKHALSKKRIAIKKPQRSIENGFLVYEMGGMKDPIIFLYSQKADIATVQRAAVALQVTVDIIRKNNNQLFWAPRLEKVEQKIGQLLTEGQRPNKSADELQKLILDTTKSIDSIYLGSLSTYAIQKKNLKGARPKEPTHFLCAIEFVTKPANAAIDWMLAGDWSFYLFMKDKENVAKPRWIRITNKEMTLLQSTAYRFRGTWGGRESIIEKVDILKNGKVELGFTQD